MGLFAYLCRGSLLKVWCLSLIRVGGACGPPPPFVAPFASSLRTHFRGDPPPKPAAADGRSAPATCCPPPEVSGHVRPRGHVLP